jgi:hypothetical protein
MTSTDIPFERRRALALANAQPTEALNAKTLAMHRTLLRELTCPY